MNKSYILGASFAAALFTGASAFAAASSTQTVTFAVSAINELSVSGNPGTMTVSTATAGSAPDSVSDTSTTYAITTNESSRLITASIDEAMPAGVTLSIELEAPTGATPAAATTLGTTAATVVSGISKLNESGKAISYNLAATAAAGVVSSQSRTVTLTIASGT